jgi:hypothetical protein
LPCPALKGICLFWVWDRAAPASQHDICRPRASGLQFERKLCFAICLHRLVFAMRICWIIVLIWEGTIKFCASASGNSDTRALGLGIGSCFFQIGSGNTRRTAFCEGGPGRTGQTPGTNLLPPLGPKAQHPHFSLFQRGPRPCPRGTQHLHQGRGMAPNCQNVFEVRPSSCWRTPVGGKPAPNMGRTPSPPLSEG